MRVQNSGLMGGVTTIPLFTLRRSAAAWRPPQSDCRNLHMEHSCLAWRRCGLGGKLTHEKTGDPVLWIPALFALGRPAGGKGTLPLPAAPVLDFSRKRGACLRCCGLVCLIAFMKNHECR